MYTQDHQAGKPFPFRKVRRAKHTLLHAWRCFRSYLTYVPIDTYESAFVRVQGFVLISFVWEETRRNASSGTISIRMLEIVVHTYSVTAGRPLYTFSCTIVLCFGVFWALCKFQFHVIDGVGNWNQVVLECVNTGMYIRTKNVQLWAIVRISVPDELFHI